jgi:hypothetical protein
LDRLVKRHRDEKMYVYLYKMGKYGAAFGPLVGELIGQIAGHHLGKYTGMNSAAGGQFGTKFGQVVGGLTRYKKGGRVKRTGKAIVHKGEYVLPRGVRPTKAQRKKVAKGKKRKSKK